VKSLTPSKSGTLERFRNPTAFAREIWSPSGPVEWTSQVPDDSSHCSLVTSVLNWMCRRTSKVSATQSKYLTFSVRGQKGFGYGKSTP
jgi:hypothetical protein